MDDTQPRHGEAGVHSPPLRVLPSVTVLADSDESPAEALEDWSRGLDWVHWLFSSIRHRLPHLHFKPAPLPAAAAAAAQLRLHAQWETFITTTLQITLAPHLKAAWHALQQRDLPALITLDKDLAPLLPATIVQASLEAGSLLLRSTRGARYQGLLGRYRAAQEEGAAPGHFIIVWAAVAHFFQLSLANVIAEHLRLEWDMAARHALPRPVPIALEDLTRFTSRLLAMAGPEESLRIVA